MTDPVSGDLFPSQRRLQRPPDFTGARLRTFRAVFLRHGLPGALLGALCFAHPELRALFGEALTAFFEAPARYLMTGVAILAALLAYAAFIDRRLDARQAGWILYLLAVSFWEEWVFRLALPALADAQGMDLRIAVAASNALFGALHYFTLRWKWPWCLGAFVGGLALSRHFGNHNDLVMVIAFHWIATFLNTPRLPGCSRIGTLDADR